jgi:hypothetical protein
MMSSVESVGGHFSNPLGQNHLDSKLPMSFRSNTARSISNDEYFIILTKRLDCWHCETDLGVKRYYRDLNYQGAE